MNKVYLVYVDLGYDGISIEGICDTLEAAREMAVGADPRNLLETVIEEWNVNNPNSKTEIARAGLPSGGAGPRVLLSAPGSAWHA